MKSDFIMLAIAGALVMLSGCGVSAENKANAKRRVELESEQAALIGDASNCGKVLQDLDEWYAANKEEVDRLDAWIADKSEGEKKDMMDPFANQRKASFKTRLMGTLRCGFVPWNGRRKPEKK